VEGRNPLPVERQVLLQRRGQRSARTGFADPRQREGTDGAWSTSSERALQLGGADGVRRPAVVQREDSEGGRRGWEGMRK
jgi:hypothetical protein